MAKSKTNAGDGHSATNATKQSAGKTSTSKRVGKTAAPSHTTTSTTKRTATKGAASTASGTQAGKGSNQQGRQAGMTKLRPIGERQTRNQMLATTAEDSGEKPGTVERVARALSRTYQRHLIRGGSGQAEIPFLGAVLCRTTQAARKEYTMKSPLAGGLEVNVPAREEQAVARLKVHPTLREIVARS